MTDLMTPEGRLDILVNETFPWSTEASTMACQTIRRLIAERDSAYGDGLRVAFEIASREVLYEDARGNLNGPWQGAAAVMNRLNKKITEHEGGVWTPVEPDPLEGE